MSLLEVGQRRARRQKKPSQYHYTLDAPLSVSHPDQVLTLVEWFRINRISERTGRRILASGNGPVVTQLSNWRVGITVKNNAKWQASRSQRAPQPPRRRRRASKARG